MRAVWLLLLCSTGCVVAFEEMLYEEEWVEDAGWVGEVAEESGWYCYEGTYRGRAVGECRPTVEGCASVVKRRRGVMGTRQCEHFKQAACFNGTRSLKKGAEVFCFPAPDQCLHYREVAIGKGLLGVTDCGLLS